MAPSSAALGQGSFNPAISHQTPPVGLSLLAAFSSAASLFFQVSSLPVLGLKSTNVLGDGGFFWRHDETANERTSGATQEASAISSSGLHVQQIN